MHWPQAAKFVRTYSHRSEYSDVEDEVLRNGAADGSDAIDENGDLICYDTPIFNETWARMEKIYESGKAKAIGVSNFSVKKYALF